MRTLENDHEDFLGESISKSNQSLFERRFDLVPVVGIIRQWSVRSEDLHFIPECVKRETEEEKVNV